MTFIVTLIALLIERFFDWSHLRQWNWYNTYQRAVGKKLSGQSSYVVLAAIIIPLLLIALVLQMLLHGVLFGFAELLFQLAIVLYCLGPQNLWADTFGCINALGQGDATFAAEKLKTSFGVMDLSASQSVHRSFLGNIFIEANCRIFAIIFWYVVLGPVGAVLYRTVALSASAFPAAETTPALAQSARTVEGVLDWMPVRLLTFLFALGGHFAKVFSFWSKKAALGLGNNDILLTECGAAALGSDEVVTIAEDGSIERSAINLLDRTFVITLVLVAIIVLIF